MGKWYHHSAPKGTKCDAECGFSAMGQKYVSLGLSAQDKGDQWYSGAG